MSLALRALQVAVGPADHDAAAAWWAAALGGSPRDAGGPSTHLDGVRAPVGVRVGRRDDDGAAYRLELAADDVATEVARLRDLGASVVTEDDAATVMADPAGLSFVVAAGAVDEALDATRGEHVDLRVLMLDVPAGDADAQAGFWAAALGGEARPVGERYPEYTWVHGVQGPAGPVHVAVQATGDATPRLHVDLHCATSTTRDAEVERLTGLGAEVAARAHHWVVLRTPGGLLACVVPDRAED